MSTKTKGNGWLCYNRKIKQFFYLNKSTKQKSRQLDLTTINFTFEKKVPKMKFGILKLFHGTLLAFEHGLK